MAQEGISAIIFGFLIVILGIVAVGVIAEQVTLNVSPTSVNGESFNIAGARSPVTGDINQTFGNNFTIANVPTWQKADGLVPFSLVVKNSTGSDLTVTTDYVFYPNQGIISLRNSTATSAKTGMPTNTTTVNYQYYQNGYLNSQVGRSAFNFIPGFYALMILVGIVALLYIFLRKIGE